MVKTHYIKMYRELKNSNFKKDSGDVCKSIAQKKRIIMK